MQMTVISEGLLLNSKCVVPENILLPPRPQGRDRIFQGGWGSICLIFQWEGGVTIGKYFQRVLVTRKRVTKKKQKFTSTIYLRRLKPRRKLKSY